MTGYITNKFTRVFLVIAVLMTPLVSASPQTAAAQVTEFDVNGMKVLIKRRPGAPTIAGGLFFRGGVRNLTADTAGLEGFTLSVAAEATKNFPRQKLRKETSRIGTSISAGANYDYSVLALSCTKQNFDLSWQMFVDVAINPTFAPDDVDRLRGGLLTALRSQSDSPEGQLDSSSDAILYAGHPYAIDPNGTIASVTRFKAAELAAYQKKLMQTSRMLLVIVGDVEPAALQKQIAASFGTLPKGDYKDTPLPPLKFAAPSVDIVSKPIQTDYVQGTFAAPSIGEPDYYAMRTAITILQANVFQEVRVKRNLSYAPDAAINNNAANTATISVSSVDPNQSIRVMLDEINKLRQTPVEDDTLGQMSGFFLTTYYIGQETNAAQAASLAQYELMGGGWRRSLEFLDRIRQVTPAEVQAAANKYMRNIRFVVVGKPSDIDKAVFLQN